MAYFNGSTSVVGRQHPQTVADRLAAVLDTLPSRELLSALQAATGRRGYGVCALWNSYIASFVLGTASISAALRRIEDDPRIAEVVGGTPSKFAMSRFIAKLKDQAGAVEQCMNHVTNLLREILPDVGATVALDSTDIKSWSRKTDADAVWSAKQGNDGHKRWWHGFKCHVSCDAKYELPLDAFVTAANASDSRQVQLSMKRLSDKGFMPRFVLADAGYDAAENYRVIADDFHGVPIIKLNLRGKRTDRFTTPHRTAAYVADHLRGLELRHNPGVVRDTSEWAELYSRRSTVERAFSRLKEFRRLNKFTMRGMLKATVHCLCAVLTTLALALAAVQSGCAATMRYGVV